MSDADLCGFMAAAGCGEARGSLEAELHQALVEQTALQHVVIEAAEQAVVEVQLELSGPLAAFGHQCNRLVAERLETWCFLDHSGPPDSCGHKNSPALWRLAAV